LLFGSIARRSLGPKKQGGETNLASLTGRFSRELSSVRSDPAGRAFLVPEFDIRAQGLRQLGFHEDQNG
jgi:hypothetical protein